MTANHSELTHPFERAGLGLAPFRYTGHSVMQYQACPGACAARRLLRLLRDRNHGRVPHQVF